MKVIIEIECDNAAFDPNPSGELGRILRGLSDKLRRHVIDTREINSKESLRDVNGNKVGFFMIQGDEQ